MAHGNKHCKRRVKGRALEKDMGYFQPSQWELEQASQKLLRGSKESHIKQGSSLCFLGFFLAALGLRCCARASSSCSEQRLLFAAVHRLLIAVASLVAEYGL